MLQTLGFKFGSLLFFYFRSNRVHFSSDVNRSAQSTINAILVSTRQLREAIDRRERALIDQVQSERDRKLKPLSLHHSQLDTMVHWIDSLLKQAKELGDKGSGIYIPETEDLSPSIDHSSTPHDVPSTLTPEPSKVVQLQEPVASNPATPLPSTTTVTTALSSAWYVDKASGFNSQSKSVMDQCSRLAWRTPWSLVGGSPRVYSDIVELAHSTVDMLDSFATVTGVELLPIQWSEHKAVNSEKIRLAWTDENVNAVTTGLKKCMYVVEQLHREAGKVTRVTRVHEGPELAVEVPNLQPATTYEFSLSGKYENGATWVGQPVSVTTPGSAASSIPAFAFASAEAFHRVNDNRSRVMLPVTPEKRKK
jgi:hypothetical protein